MSDGVKQHPVQGDGWRGWIRSEEGSNRRFISPNGVNVSNAQFIKLRNQFPQGHVPDYVLQELTRPKQPGRGFMTGSFPSIPAGQSGGTGNPSPNPSPNPSEQPSLVTIEPTVRKSKSAGGKASAKELYDGIHITLAIVTSIVSLVVGEAELAMTEQEAKNIAIPLSNLLLDSKINEKWGRAIADSGDYQMLGYALFLYLSRVTEAIKAKRGNTNVGIFGRSKRQSEDVQRAAPATEPAAGNGAVAPSLSANGTYIIPSSPASAVRPPNAPGIR